MKGMCRIQHRHDLRKYDRIICHARPANLQGGLIGFEGFAAIPIAMLDPPRRVASPMVIALQGSESLLRSLPEQCGKSFPESGKFFPGRTGASP